MASYLTILILKGRILMTYNVDEIKCVDSHTNTIFLTFINCDFLANLNQEMNPIMIANVALLYSWPLQHLLICWLKYVSRVQQSYVILNKDQNLRWYLLTRGPLACIYVIFKQGMAGVTNPLAQIYL